MYGYIYITANLTNGKQYIGQKKSKTFIGNKYLGSGKILKQAIEKDGKNNFSVELLECCDTKDNLDLAEIKWIKHFDAVKSDKYYNISKGGEAGSGGDKFKGHHHSIETRLKMSESRKGSKNSNYGNRWNQTDELKDVHRQAVLGCKNGMYNKKHKDSTKKLISNNAKDLRWVCNEHEIKRVHTNQIDYYISLGCKNGRKF